jgi:ribosomal protein S18 acetylase RimI-like enzyme
MDASIRKAVRSDVDDVIAFDHVAATDRQRHQRILGGIDHGEIDVIEVNEMVVGYILMHHNFYGNGFVELLYIHPGHRRKGLGFALIRHCEAECRTEKLFISTNQSNAAMRELLSKAGFVKSGVIENLDEGDPELVFFKWITK